MKSWITIHNGVHFTDGYDITEEQACNELSVPQGSVRFFYWAKDLDSSRIDLRSWVSETFLRFIPWVHLPIDYVDDVITLISDRKLRARLEQKLDEFIIDKDTHVHIFHSLATCLMWSARKDVKGKVIFLGSPMWILPLQWIFGGKPNYEIINVSGLYDPISAFGLPLVGKTITVKCGHRLEHYLRKIRHLLR